MAQLSTHVPTRRARCGLTQGSGGKSNGIISKPRFNTALGMAFHQYPLDEKFIAAISLKYGTGAPDTHGGGYQEVLWRTFVIELRSYQPPAPPAPPNPFDPRIAHTMSELRQIAEDSGLAMVHAMQVRTLRLVRGG